jgi:glutaconate CoA-transferase subunit A
MSKLVSMREAITRYVPDGASVAMGLALEPLIPYAAGHEIIRQRRRGLTLIGPISDILFDILIGAGCVEKITATAGPLRKAFHNALQLKNTATLRSVLH